jgi:radical SAM superfamily enzyme YgiQ (UPF0313 family)
MKQIKALLVNSPNRRSEPPRHYPYGLAIVGNLIQNLGNKVNYFDGNFASFEDYKKTLREGNYNFIGVSGLVTTYPYQREVSRITKQVLPNSVVGVGGGLAGAVQEELLRLIPEVDVVFIGEGETSVPPFIDTMAEGLSYSKVPGIIYREGHRIVNNGTSPLAENFDLVPNLEGMEIERYFENGSFPLSPNVQSAQRRGNILTSRGCPFNCDFCFNLLGRKKVRYRSKESVMEEISYLIDKYKIDFISFMDESFLSNKNKAREVAEKMARTGLRWGIAARSTSVDKDILRDIKQSGCDYIYYGFDSGSPETLKVMGKKMTTEDNFEAFRLSIETGIYPVPNIIIGYDNETQRNIDENYEFFDKLIKYGKTLKSSEEKRFFEMGFNNFGAIYFATPYPGSQLYERNSLKIPSLEQVLEKVAFKDAYELTVNVSSIPNDILIKEQKKMERFVRGFKL